jgi:hypothetical protein
MLKYGCLQYSNQEGYLVSVGISVPALISLGKETRNLTTVYIRIE